MYVSIKECASFFGVHASTIRGMVKNGSLPCVMFGSRYRVNLEAAEAKLLGEQRERREAEEKKAQALAARKSFERKCRQSRGNYIERLNAL